MKALLLAAGLGTRLHPITEQIQKCLVPIGGKPLIEYWLENLSKTSISHCIINTHYHAQQMQEYIQNSDFKTSTSLVYEEELLLTGGTLLHCASLLENEAFMLVHADNLSFCDFNAFIDKHNKRPNNILITMLLFKTDTPSSCGIVEINAEGIVQKFHEKVANPPSNLANGAVYICEPEIVEFLKTLDREKIDFSTEVIPHFLGQIQTYLNEDYHRDIGTLESYAKAQIDMYFRSKD